MKGISDLTSSEGDLVRFSNMCRMIGSRGPTRKRFTEKVKKQLQLTNQKVIDRHISILEKLEVIKSVAERIVLLSEGKVLYDFIEHLDASRRLLTHTEVVFYFKALFKNAEPQLVAMLRTISENDRKHRENQIAAYFEKVMTEIPGLWDSESIRRNLRKFTEEKVISRFFENKFRCMEKWLISLGLLSKLERRTVLTDIGRSCLKKIDKYDFNTAIHLNELAGLVARRESETYIEPSLYLWNQEKVVRRNFLTACKKFQIGPGLVDLQAARSWITTILIIKEGIVLEDDVFDSLLNLWQNQGIIRSIMVGVNGKRDIISV